ncbi:DUF2185 domain-containing protein [Pseudoclavibacter alba]|uniref:DUF2185 domain-containing protein n=1 Tax=Pseudoclavibacter albus TaxID=272241 RepID=A0ABT2HYY9_9MICO|nr:DUF2185 domain-containing protein [Pseudoclavibacter alba]MCT2043335.1 DUF2185 domain-containing protein [Pseudoclavibacter alba]
MISEAGKIRWMVRDNSRAPADNGWQILSDIDTSSYLNHPANWQIVDFNEVCMIEPALIGIWNLPVGSDLELRRDDAGIHIIDSKTGHEIPRDKLYIPPMPGHSRGSRAS